MHAACGWVQEIRLTKSRVNSTSLPLAVLPREVGEGDVGVRIATVAGAAGCGLRYNFYQF